MSITASALDEILGAVDRLIAGREKLRDALIDQINGLDAYDRLRPAETEVKKAGKKLARIHPDAEDLAIARWSDCQQGFFILGELDRRQAPDTNWKNDKINEITAHDEKIGTELRKLRKSLCQKGMVENAENTLQPLIALENRNYQIGSETIVIDDNEETVMQAFFKDARTKPAWVPITYTELRRRTNLEHAPRILGTMRTKYPTMAKAIDCPGKRGRGGLKVFLARRGRSR